MLKKLEIPKNKFDTIAQKCEYLRVPRTPNQTNQMKIDNLIISGTLPKGEITVAALSNQTCRISKWKNTIKNIPHGVARCRSKYSQCNLVILLQDALNHGIPYITTKSLKNY